ncbi:MAG: dipicolinate synthase subunit DpsA [Firmicutes bacterium]|nr:dipicolinate synthase subunit DpsA [Bacillota bacterium]
MAKFALESGVAMLGGDQRQVLVAEAMLAMAPWVKTLGLAGLPAIPRLLPAADLKEALTGAQVIILPISGVDARGLVKTSDPTVEIKIDPEFFTLVESNALLVTGMFPAHLQQLAAEKGIRVCAYGDHDAIAIPNAIPTAEGAIQLMMEKTPYTVYGAACLVLGFGRVARALTSRLQALGAKVTVAARNPQQLAEAAALGYEPLPLAHLDRAVTQAGVVFNTIPALVLTAPLLAQMAPETLIIDLASAPGGVDFEAAKRYQLTAILALGLPGKVAPRTAGQILATSLPGLIKQELSRLHEEK